MHKESSNPCRTNGCSRNAPAGMKTCSDHGFLPSLNNHCPTCGEANGATFTTKNFLQFCSELCCDVYFPDKPIGNNESPVSKIMEEAIKTFEQRHKVYGDNYKLAAKALEAFFPNGLPLKTVQDHERFHIFMLIIVKLSRYSINWSEPHQDSIHDAGIYSFMLETIDARHKEESSEITYKY